MMDVDSMTTQVHVHYNYMYYYMYFQGAQLLYERESRIIIDYIDLDEGYKTVSYTPTHLTSKLMYLS